MWEFIDKVVYINLDHREDRRQIMQKLFDQGQIPTEKVERFSAIKHKVGIIGCAMGHISILKRAKEQKWKSVLILEDDLEWIDFKENYNKLEELVSNPFDVCMLGGMYILTDPPKIISAIYTNAYIVKSHYYDTLLNNFEYGLSQKLNKIYVPPLFPKITSSKRERIYLELVEKDNCHNVDIYWMKLQIKDNWVGIISPMIRQVISFSDIYGTSDRIYHDNDIKEFGLSWYNFFKSCYI